MANFGWSYPPGCSGPPDDDDRPCNHCGRCVYDCICEVCEICGVIDKQNCHTEIDGVMYPNQLDVFRANEAKGFWPNGWQTQPLMVIGKIALISTEVYELSIAPDVDNYCEELADISIRVLDLCGALAFNIWPRVINRVLIYPGSESDMYPIVARVLEFYRKDNLALVQESFVELLARCDHLCQQRGHDLIEEINKKLAINAQRPHLHGKKA